jgi:hypothetical protein
MTADRIQTGITRSKNNSQDVSFAVLTKGDERYLVLYTDANRVEACRTVGRWAANPDLSFTWHDAARMAQQIR